MTFELVATYYAPEDAEEDTPNSYRHEDWQAFKYKWVDAQSLVRFTFPDGESVLTAQENFQCGQCNCCSRRDDDWFKAEVFKAKELP
jgi:hypothetical protein